MRLTKQRYRLPMLALVATLLLSGCVTISDPIEEPSAILPTATSEGRVVYDYQSPTPAPESAAEPTIEVAESATPTPTLTPTTTPAPIRYAVQQGDTLSTIAQKHAISLEALKTANNLADADRLSIGQELIIPTSDPLVATEEQAQPRDAAGHILHFVRVGETPSMIAAQYNIERSDVLLANGFRPDVQLTAGEPILIPQGEYTPVATATPPAATPVPTLVLALDASATPLPASPTTVPTAAPSTYTVRQGDIAGTIARAHSITVDQLAAANPGTNVERLSIGQTLTIPSGAVSSVKATPTAVTLMPTATPTPPPPVLTTYKSKEGETLASVASLFGLSEETLKSYNPTIGESLAAETAVQVPIGTATPTPTSTPFPTLTPTPTPAFLAPVLLLPPDDSLWVQWEGRQSPQLVWTASGILKEDEFYVVRIRAVSDKGEVLWSQAHWTQSPNWRLNEDILRPITEEVTLRWDVMVMKQTSAPGAEPRTGEALSSKSETYQIRYTPPTP